MTKKSYIEKACPCDVILDCQTGGVFFVHDKSVICFGSM